MVFLETGAWDLIAEILNKAAANGAFAEVAIAAPPPVLSGLRGKLSAKILRSDLDAL